MCDECSDERTSHEAKRRFVRASARHICGPLAAVTTFSKNTLRVLARRTDVARRTTWVRDASGTSSGASGAFDRFVARAGVRAP